MTVKEHYEHHLSGFYSWMMGDFGEAKDKFKDFCSKHNIVAANGSVAVDLGSGNGIQSIALAEIGYSVIAVDFNQNLLSELEARIEKHLIECVCDDIMNVRGLVAEESVDLLVCCGDTIAHLATFEQLDQLLQDCYRLLRAGGKLILSFRDYSKVFVDTQRFIPVKSDESRILTCVVDYYEHKIKVTDLLHVKEDGCWKQKISSYDKLRLTTDYVIGELKALGYVLESCSDVNRMIYVIARR